MAPIVEAEPRGTTLVVGVDASSYAEHVLTVARDLVRIADRATIHVVTVVRPDPLPPDGLQAITTGFGLHDEETVRAAHDLLRDLCARALGGSAATVHLHVRVGRAADEIEKLAEDVDADVIVVEAHGRTGLARMFHKSVAAELARNAPCSVLTVRTKHGVPAARSRPAVSAPHA